LAAGGFDMEREGGYGEWYQHIKEAVIVVLFGVLVVQRRQAVYLAWMSLAAYLFVDDTFMVHESVGRFAQSTPGLAEFDWAPHVGELLSTALAGVLFLSLIGVCHVRSKPADRAINRRLLVLLFALGFFGVVVDQLTAPFRGYLGGVFVLIEDGGEMVVFSVMISYLLSVLRQSPRPEQHRAHPVPTA
ncbi:MAG: hypothetical protein WD873_05980, partial [Candidatus Hydrogenedentales bacterium]